MAGVPHITSIAPTILLRRAEDGLAQLLRATIANPGPSREATVIAEWNGGRVETPVSLPADQESTHDPFLPEPSQPREVVFSLVSAGEVLHRLAVTCGPPHHLRVHLVQHSHHDVGYTDLASSVLREHCLMLDEALDLAAATASYPDDARFRLVIEQAWSLQEFARTAPPERLALMGEMLRRGDAEITALFGNMVTEICGPEEIVRAMYPSMRLARLFGCDIVSAEHNDVPGVSWGLCEVLAETGLRFFCPRLPRYWDWIDPPLRGFWDEGVLFPKGRPGGFWWEAPSGKRMLLWDVHGTGHDVRADLPGLADRLQALVDRGYPYSAVYWLVQGGARDNSHYIADFCDTVREWNERWAFPRLSISTNARFWADLEPQLGDDVPVFHGELPGQDYPVGSACTATATSANRTAHVQLLVAERLASMASQATDFPYPADSLDRAYEDILWYDEHTWGHHFPAGPTADASFAEKQVHAYRAAALAQDVTVRSLARLADHVDLPGDGLYLVVFNPLPQPRTAPVATPLREIENCGTVMAPMHEPDGATYLRGVALTDRTHLNPPPDIVAGGFDLIDLATGETVDFEIADLDADSPVPYAPQRSGLGDGGLRYGFAETPNGVGRDLIFVARDLPACGYKTYELRPANRQPRPRVARPDPVIENEFFRLEADSDSGRVTSLIDKTAGRELLDPAAPHAFAQMVVRDPDGELAPPLLTASPVAHSGTLREVLDLRTSSPGHPAVRTSLILHRGIPRLDLALRLLKDPTPQLDVHLAFPFAIDQPRFRYESLLAVQEPLADYLPGAYWDEVAVQNWVGLTGGGLSLLWSSLDAPMVALGLLTPGYTSPAHSCRIPARAHHDPAGADQLARGWLYSLLCANNFGTNFAVSQTGSLLFRYSLTTAPGEMTDVDAVRLGGEAVTPPETIFTERACPGHLPLTTSLLSFDGDPLALLACKHAEDGHGLIVRLWNPAARATTTTVRLAFASISDARPVSPVEDDACPSDAEVALVDDHAFTVHIGSRGLATVRLLLAGGRP